MNKESKPRSKAFPLSGFDTIFVDMGKIKSAWEIALEKTQSIKVDENRIRENQRIDEVKRIAGAFLSDEETDDTGLSRLDGYSDKEVKAGLKVLLLSSLSLSAGTVDEQRLSRLTRLATYVFKDEQSHGLYLKLLDVIKQYPDHRKQLIEQLEESLEPSLRQKEEMMRQKLGRDVHLTIEDDKEAMEIVNKNLDKLDNEYNKIIDGSKRQLESYFD